MLREKKPSEPDEPAGAPTWMVTFSDCMTLLLTFFVLLLSFSSFDDKVFLRLETIFADGYPAVYSQTEKNKDAFLPVEQIQSIKELEEGSEKPTLEKEAQDDLKEETESIDFQNRKVFLISSDKIFWGKGTVISYQGRKILATMSSFIKEVPNRVVISENGVEDERNSKHFGLPRAWAVVKYLTAKQGLDKTRFSISLASTLNKETLKNGEQNHTATNTKRGLEIVLLEQGIYN